MERQYGDRVRIAFLLVRHEPGRASPIMPDVMRLLADRGATVGAIYPDEEDVTTSSRLTGHDLCVVKAKTARALRYAEAVHADGVATVNPYPVTALCRDKIATTEALRVAGVTVPRTFVEPDPRRLAPLLNDGPLVVKPYRGSQGRGVRVVRRTEDLAHLAAGPDPVMAQRYLPPDGRDQKIYRIGEEYFCVKRVWPPMTYADKLGEPAPVTGEVRELAHRCGEALGIDLYGVDVIVSRGQPFVVDLSSFPGFKGVPDVARRLAEYLHARAQG
jgi:ribosomal protein S6--L-glutamate ligase